jgi:hypothetical protein
VGEIYHQPNKSAAPENGGRTTCKKRTDQKNSMKPNAGAMVVFFSTSASLLSLHA